MIKLEKSICQTVAFRKTKIEYNLVFSSPEPMAQGELLSLANVRRASSVVRRLSSVVNNCFKQHLL